MGYLTAKQFSEKWGISERRIIKLCKEKRIQGAIKNGMVWEIPEETLKPSDRRSNIYQYINTQKRIMLVNPKEEVKQDLIALLEKEGYLVDTKQLNERKDDLGKTVTYYEGLIYFPMNRIDKNEELFIMDFANKLHSESSIVIVDYDAPKRNKIEEKLAEKFKSEIGLKINTLILKMPKSEDAFIHYNEIAEDIITLLIKLKNTTGMAITTDGGGIEFDEKGRSKNLETGKFYKAINQYFKKLNKESYLWCASTMLEDEWTDSPQEMKFRIINLEVANRGVKVERIFIFRKDKVKEYRKNKTLKIYIQSNIKTLFVDYDEIMQKAPNLLKILANGWDGIDQDTLIVDLPEGGKERGYISKNTKDVREAYHCFQELKKYANDLREVLEN